MMPYPVIGGVLSFAMLCVVADVRSRRIPNALSAAGVIAGVALNTGYAGVAGLGASAAGLVALIAVLLAPFAAGGIGGGDVKMMGAIGAFLGWRLGFAALALGMILGGIIMMAHLARLGRLREKLVATGRMLSLAVLTRSAAPLGQPAREPDAITLPYSVPLALGTLAAVVLSRINGGI